MDAVLAKYPFTGKVHEFVRQSGKKMEDLLTDASFAREVRKRAGERVLQALEGEIKKPPLRDGDIHAEIELFSYPVARVIASILNDHYLIRRYALAEAKAAYADLKSEESSFLKELCEEFQIRVAIETDSRIRVHFTSYLQLASSIRESKWKLVNRRLREGWVTISKNELARLLQEAIRRKIQDSLPVQVPEDISKVLSGEVNEVSARLLEQKSSFEFAQLEKVDIECFPPCMAFLFKSARSGRNLPHSARFALTAFLLNIGMGVEEVVEVFKVLPDFDEEKTRYQVEHISGKSGTRYTSPGCSTMATYGNCLERDRACDFVTHPLGYYRKRLEFKLRDEGKKEEGEVKT